MNTFESFNIKYITHVENHDTNMLENAASNNDPTYNIFAIELICRPSIPCNKKRIFNDGQQIMDFIQLEITIKGLVINDKQHGSLLHDSVSEGNPKLRNTLPMNIFRLENIFDLQTYL